MRTRFVWLVVASMIGFLVSGPGRAQEVTNLIQDRNPGFEAGVLAPWNTWGGGSATVTTAIVKDCVGAAVPEGPIEGNYCLYVTVSGPSTNWYQCSFVTQGPTFVEGQEIHAFRLSQVQERHRTRQHQAGTWGESIRGIW